MNTRTISAFSWFCRFLWSIAVARPRVAAIAGATPSSLRLCDFALNQRNAKTRWRKGAKVGNHRIHQNQAFSGALALAPMLTLALLLAVSASPALALSRENNVYFEPQTVYMPECGNATVQIMLNATDEIDRWSTIVEFDYESVNITGVRFAGGITPTYADWGYHTDYVYIGGTDLNKSSGTGLLLATITLECNRTGTGASAGASTSPLHFAGEEGIERLIAGETIHPATWTGGAAQSVKRGNVNCAGDVDMSDVALLLNHVYDAGGYPLSCEWAGDINGAGEIDMSDVALLLNHVHDAEGYPLSCG